ncbi:MAG: DNA mismatch repair endonuclease MutL [Clostridiales bacterium]|jgi:DNA mismatch repair protein MutL|nr:DNA mismatch repair endonuclease MutL [Clostridiales bacterium]
MSSIQVLDEATINQIAAGEVVERPRAVVKELVENSVDAGATAITVEIKEGGLSLIRVTDNGGGIEKEDISNAFLRHATSKIRTAQDLLSVTSLGFRGEALSSIAAVAQVELITKTPQSLNGFRYLIKGGEEEALEEIGCPDGTTILVRNLFYNTPARRKFLKSSATEAGYVSDLMERLMISHPDISFKYIVNNQVKLQSSGNNNRRDILYQIYGRDITKELLTIEYQGEGISITGYIGKPSINRGNRNYENYYINGRFIKSTVITKAIEEAYKPFLMQHKYPFTSLYFEIEPSLIDVNVHPQKLEIRLKNSEDIYQSTFHAIRNTLTGKELIPKVTLTKEEKLSKKEDEQINKKNVLPEPFERNRRDQMEALKEKTQNIPLFNIKETYLGIKDTKSLSPTIERDNHTSKKASDVVREDLAFTKAKVDDGNSDTIGTVSKVDRVREPEQPVGEQPFGEQLNFISDEANAASAPFLSKEALKEHRIIGQIFSTYWLVEYQKELFIIDQHAAHEKVLYERILAAAKEKTYESQYLMPPIVLTLTLMEQNILQKYKEVLNKIGYEFEPFGGNEISVRAVPSNLYGLPDKELLLEFIDEMTTNLNSGSINPSSVLERIASLSCKAAIKANHSFTKEEAVALIKELLLLENPYHCPHGRPVIISMSKYEIEKKFKRIV